MWSANTLFNCSLLLLIISSSAAGMDGSRHLLQLKSDCPFDFSTVDYRPITDVCKDPYPSNPCCGAFKNVTCKYLVYFNDQNTTCADNMFAYLNSAGNYPGGLFSNLCVEGAEGLACPLAPTSAPSSARRTNASFLFYMFNALCLGFILWSALL